MSQGIDSIDFEDLHKWVHRSFIHYYNKWWARNNILNIIINVTGVSEDEANQIMEIMISLGMIEVKKDSVLVTYNIVKNPKCV